VSNTGNRRDAENPGFNISKKNSANHVKAIPGTAVPLFRKIYEDEKIRYAGGHPYGALIAIINSTIRLPTSKFLGGMAPKSPQRPTLRFLSAASPTLMNMDSCAN